MSFDKAVKELGLVLSNEVVFACRLLESRGYRFMIDFGYMSAIEKAANIPIERA
jgi:hypothetical protein